MNAIIGMAGLLADTALGAEQRKMLQVMQGGAESLLAIVSDILDFSRIEAGKLRLEQAEFELLRGPPGTGKRKWLVALLYLRRHVLVHPDGWAADNDPTVLNHFDALVNWEAVPLQ